MAEAAEIEASEVKKEKKRAEKTIRWSSSEKEDSNLGDSWNAHVIMFTPFLKSGVLQIFIVCKQSYKILSTPDFNFPLTKS